MMKKVILLTGPLGVGKSVALQVLAEFGHATLDADEMAHRAMQRGAPGYQQLLERFGPQVLDGFIRSAHVAVRGPEMFSGLSHIGGHGYADRHNRTTPHRQGVRVHPG